MPHTNTPEKKFVGVPMAHPSRKIGLTAAVGRACELRGGGSGLLENQKSSAGSKFSKNISDTPKTTV